MSSRRFLCISFWLLFRVLFLSSNLVLFHLPHLLLPSVWVNPLRFLSMNPPPLYMKLFFVVFRSSSKTRATISFLRLPFPLSQSLGTFWRYNLSYFRSCYWVGYFLLHQMVIYIWKFLKSFSLHSISKNFLFVLHHTIYDIQTLFHSCWYNFRIISILPRKISCVLVLF